MRAADAGSLSAAARLLDLTPSALSRGITELEAALGVTVFYRTTRQLRLTEDGEELYRRGRRLLDGLADLDAAMSHRAHQLTGILRVGVSVNISRYIVMPGLARFMRRHPALRVELWSISHPREMHARGIDVLLRAGLPADSSLVARKLAEQRFHVYAAPAYLDSAGVPQAPGDLLRHRCIVHAPAALARPLDEWVFERAGARETIRVPPVLRTDDREALIAAVLDGAGIMRIGMFDPALVTGGRLRQVLTDWSCPGGQSFYALYRKAARLPLRVAAFVAFAEQAFAAFDPDGVTMVRTLGRRGAAARPTRSNRGSADP